MFTSRGEHTLGSNARLLVVARLLDAFARRILEALGHAEAVDVLDLAAARAKGLHETVVGAARDLLEVPVRGLDDGRDGAEEEEEDSGELHGCWCCGCPEFRVEVQKLSGKGGKEV